MATSSRSSAKWTRVTLVNQAHTRRPLGLVFRRGGKPTLVIQIHFKRITRVTFPPPRKSNPCIPSYDFKRFIEVIFPPPRKSNPCIPSRFKRITGVNPCNLSRGGYEQATGVTLVHVMDLFLEARAKRNSECARLGLHRYTRLDKAAYPCRRAKKSDPKRPGARTVHLFVHPLHFFFLDRPFH